MTTFASVKDQVESLYLGYFGHTGDTAGTSYWVSQIEFGAMTLAKVAESFAVQPEAVAKYAYLSAPSISSPTDFINQVYQQLFNHAADAAGLAYWTEQLASAQGSPQAIGQFIGNVISGATGADDTTVKNKVDMPQAVTPKAPDVAPTPTVPVAPQPPVEIAPTNDTAAPVTNETPAPTMGGDTLLISGAGWINVLYGSDFADTGVFTIVGDFTAATIVGDGATPLSASTGWVVLTGLNQALVAADIL